MYLNFPNCLKNVFSQVVCLNRDPNKVYPLYSYRAFKFLNQLSNVKIWVSHKYQIFSFSWRKKNGKTGDLAAVPSSQHAPGGRVGGDGHSSAPPPGPTCAAGPLEAALEGSNLSLPPHTGSHLGQRSLNPPTHCPVVVLFPPSEQASRICT